MNFSARNFLLSVTAFCFCGTMLLAQRNSLGIHSANDANYDSLKAAGVIRSGEKIVNGTSAKDTLSIVRVGQPPHVSSSVLCECLVPIDNSFQLVPFTNGVPADDYRNDDGSSPQIALPFQFCFYGTNINSV
jgi:hypothetical protein